MSVVSLKPSLTVGKNGSGVIEVILRSRGRRVNSRSLSWVLPR